MSARGFCFVLAALMLAALPGTAAEPAEACLAEKIVTRQLACLSAAAQEAGDAKLCLRGEQPAVRFNCISLYAERARDPAICALIPAEDSAPPGVLQETCRVGLAIVLNDPEICAGLATPNLGDACLLQMVEAGADTALCARIENAALRAACGGG
jgi:hypothetical protein